MPDSGAACASRSGRTSAAVGNPLVPAGAVAELGQPSRETDGERLEIFGQLHGRQQQGVILQVARGRAGQIGLVERLADPAADPRPHPAVAAHPAPLPVPPPPSRTRDRRGSAPCQAPWGGTGARGAQRAGPASTGERTGAAPPPTAALAFAAGIRTSVTQQHCARPGWGARSEPTQYPSTSTLSGGSRLGTMTAMARVGRHRTG